MQNIADELVGKTAELRHAQANLIKSQVNILGVTAVGETKITVGDRESVSLPEKLAVIYEFPYRKNGERFWCKQVYMVKGEDGIGDKFYLSLASKVLELRKELEG